MLFSLDADLVSTARLPASGPDTGLCDTSTQQNARSALTEKGVKHENQNVVVKSSVLTVIFVGKIENSSEVLSFWSATGTHSQISLRVKDPCCSRTWLVTTQVSTLKV